MNVRDSASDTITYGNDEKNPEIVDNYVLGQVLGEGKLHTHIHYHSPNIWLWNV